MKVLAWIAVVVVAAGAGFWGGRWQSGAHVDKKVLVANGKIAPDSCQVAVPKATKAPDGEKPGEWVEAKQWQPKVLLRIDMPVILVKACPSDIESFRQMVGILYANAILPDSIRVDSLVRESVQLMR